MITCVFLYDREDFIKLFSDCHFLKFFFYYVTCFEAFIYITVQTECHHSANHYQSRRRRLGVIVWPCIFCGTVFFSPAARVFYNSLVFLNSCRVLSQCNTRLSHLLLLDIIIKKIIIPLLIYLL